MRRSNLLKINGKIKAYYGFLERSRELVYGVDNFAKQKLYLILISSDLSQNAKDRASLKAKTYNCKLFELESKEFNDLVKNEKIKAVGAKSEELANAIISQLEIQEEQN